jgi:hypothetical protein
MVAVRVKPGTGVVTFCAGQHYELRLAEGETATKWANGSPITRWEFQRVLSPAGLFEIAPEGASAIAAGE